MGRYVRRAFNEDTLPYSSPSRCIRLTDANLIQADLEDRFFEGSSYDVLKDNMGGL